VEHEGGEFAYEEASVECLHCGNVGEPKQFRTTNDLEAFRLTVRGRF
jgi:transcription initiation factor TFIIIB Brf1 subunit/transcription initiation factor TFIIB